MKRSIDPQLRYVSKLWSSSISDNRGTEKIKRKSNYLTV